MNLNLSSIGLLPSSKMERSIKPNTNDNISYKFVQTNGTLTKYTILRVAHAPGMPGTFSPHHGLAIPTCITERAWRTCRDACQDR